MNVKVFGGGKLCNNFPFYSCLYRWPHDSMRICNGKPYIYLNLYVKAVTASCFTSGIKQNEYRLLKKCFLLPLISMTKEYTGALLSKEKRKLGADSIPACTHNWCWCGSS